MSEANLGNLIDETAQRDAIHVAIAPVIAGCDGLLPGMHIGFIAGGSGEVANQTSQRRGITPIGIVDPFLKTTPHKGSRFYMVLYPKSITSLRHDWTHPAFPRQVLPTEGSKEESELWLRMYAKEKNCYDEPEAAFQRLIDGLRSRELYFRGSDLHGLYELDDARELKEHAERYLGIEIDFGEFTFSCSC